MEKKTHVYKSPRSGHALLTVIASNCRTPVLPIKYSNLINPFYYPNSPKVPRYSVTCIIDPKENEDFLSDIYSIETNEKVETVVKNESIKKDNEMITTGNVTIKFQGKEIIPIYIMEDSKPVEIKLEDEFAQGEKIIVVYDILRYTKKNTTQTVEHGLNFKPVCIYFYPVTA